MIEHEISAATDLNHGLGMAIIYLAWMEYVLDAIPERFAQFGERVWGLSRDGASEREIGLRSIERTRELWRSLGIPTTLSAAGVDSSILPTAARQAVRFGPIGSLKQLTEADVTRILDSVA
jgi:alcohol dehydrogenase YqhD (iron-dependent ADH family)